MPFFLFNTIKIKKKKRNYIELIKKNICKNLIKNV